MQAKKFEAHWTPLQDNTDGWIQYSRNWKNKGTTSTCLLLRYGQTISHDVMFTYVVAITSLKAALCSPASWGQALAHVEEKKWQDWHVNRLAEVSPDWIWSNDTRIGIEAHPHASKWICWRPRSQGLSGGSAPLIPVTRPHDNLTLWGEISSGKL